MQEYSRQYTSEIFVSLPDLTANLAHLTDHTRCLVRHNSSFIATITLGRTGSDQPPHFIVRPYGCDSRRIAEMTSEFVLEIPKEQKTFHIDPNGVGGHYAQGVRISIAGYEVTLPAIKSVRSDPNQRSDSSALSQTEFSPEIGKLRNAHGSQQEE